jgi:hypothetical protein
VCASSLAHKIKFSNSFALKIVHQFSFSQPKYSQNTVDQNDLTHCVLCTENGQLVFLWVADAL